MRGLRKASLWELFAIAYGYLLCWIIGFLAGSRDAGAVAAPLVEQPDSVYHELHYVPPRK